MRLTILSILLIFIYGCGNNNHNTSNNFQEYLYNLLKTEYFWADKVDNNVDLKKYSDPNEMIEDLRYKSKDRWSFAITKEQNNNFLQQKSEGFGFAFLNNDDIALVIYTRLNSPANIAGLKRGDLIEAINGTLPTQENILKASRDLNRSSIFKIYRESTDETLYITIRPKEYKFKVSQAKILDNDIGYFRLDSFTSDATKEIEDSFNLFKKENIHNLIIDLRYNQGGSVITASILLDKLMRNRDDEPQFILKWNSHYNYKNSILTFETDSNSLSLDKIAFLTTKQTASASETVINALRPYFGDDMAIVGSKTYGKPVGMEGKSDGKYIYYLINFIIANRNGFYDYFDGLDVTNGCSEVDDITHQLGDKNELMLKKALFYIYNGNC